MGGEKYENGSRLPCFGDIKALGEKNVHLFITFL